MFNVTVPIVSVVGEEFSFVGQLLALVDGSVAKVSKTWLVSDKRTKK